MQQAAANLSNHIHQVSAEFITRLLIPLARIMLRNGVSCHQFTEMARDAYVRAAEQPEFRLPGTRQTKSRISALTGLSRKEVARRQQRSTEGEIRGEPNRIARVLSGWAEDPTFRDAGGAPAILPVRGRPPTFRDLARIHGADVPYQVLLEEMIRVGAVRQAPDGQVELRRLDYIPVSGSGDQLRIAGDSSIHLAETLERNLRPGDHAPFLQREAYYPFVPEDRLEELHGRVQQEMDKHLKNVNELIREYAVDRPELGRRYYRAGLGAYFFAAREAGWKGRSIR